MAFSIFKDQEGTIRLLQDNDLFKKYFKPLVGLQSNSHPGMDAVQHTVATVRSIENILTELKKTQDIEFSVREIRALHLAALFLNTGKAKVKAKIGEFGYTDYIEGSTEILTNFYNFMRRTSTLELEITLKLSIWLVREHSNFYRAIKSNNLHKWIVDNIRSGDFETILSYRDMVRTMIVLLAASSAANYALCEDEYHYAIIRYTAERYAVLSKIKELNIPVSACEIEVGEDTLDKRDAERILYMCWNGEIQNTQEQIEAAIAKYRANKKYTVSIAY